MTEFLTKKEQNDCLEKYQQSKNTNDLVPLIKNLLNVRICNKIRNLYVESFEREDLLQECYMICFSQIMEYLKLPEKKPCSIFTYLYNGLNWRLGKLVKKHLKQQMIRYTDKLEIYTDVISDRNNDFIIEEKDIIDLIDIQHLIEKIDANLSPKQKEYFIEVFVNDKTAVQVAKERNLSAGWSVNISVHAALRKLRKLFKEEKLDY